MKATRPSVASMESRYTLKSGTPYRTKKKLRNKATSYTGTNVAGLNAMMSTLGNQPEPLKKNIKNT